MAGSTLTLEFAGDADKLQKAAKQASKATDDVAAAAKSAGDDFKKSSQESANFTDRIGKLGAGVSGATDAFDSAASAVQSLADIQQAGVERASQMKRALNDLEQAQEDANQAVRDGRQANIDAETAATDLKEAQLDQAAALRDYNQAVRAHGKDSEEAARAGIALERTGTAIHQAQEDAAQATRDAAQATIDAKKAQLDLNDAQREAHPPELQKFADQIGMVMPLLSGMAGIVGLVTAAQWAWNAAQLANPTTWIVLGILALVAVIVLLVKHWDWVKRAGAAAWNWIKDAAGSTWNFIKKIPGWIGNAFKSIANFISLPFRTAFNFIADAWNNTIGRLSWSVPDWIPGIGGNTISVPNLPKFHSGGVVPGAPGSEMLAVLQAGETVTPAGGARTIIEIRSGGTNLDDLLVEVLSRAVRRRGGNVQLALGGRNV